MAFDYGDKDELLRDAEAFIDEEWETVLRDMGKLIAVNSVESEPDVMAGAPFGPGPRQALDVMLEIAGGYGFEVGDESGYMGFADLPGNNGAGEAGGCKQLGIIGHLDIVPASEGWHFDPFTLTRKDGYLLGRGTADDKGPLVCALHALRFWKERNGRLGVAFPHDVRMLFGCNEETGMHDVDGYLAAHKAPDFLFTPDADFPVGYGEKGQFTAWLSSERIRGGRLLQFEGGSVTNGVPARATAVVRRNGASYGEAERIEVLEVGDFCTDSVCYSDEDLLLITAEGISGHAAFPAGSVNAIGLLTRYLLENDLVSLDERAWLEFVLPALETTDGSAFGIDCADDDFGSLTCVGGVASLEDGVFKQSIDIRYPTATGRDDLMRRIGMCVANVSGGVAEKQHMEPFLMDPQSAPIQQMLDAYRQATGNDGEPFTMGGGTYARHFPVGVSFGPEDEHFEKPDWVGSMHGPDEGVSEEALRQAMKVYILAIGNLMKTDL